MWESKMLGILNRHFLVEHFSGPILQRIDQQDVFFSSDEGFLTESHLLRNWSLDLKAVKAEITGTCRKFLFLLLSGGIL